MKESFGRNFNERQTSDIRATQERNEKNDEKKFHEKTGILKVFLWFAPAQKVYIYGMCM